jgi:hypothetical protein
MTTNLDEGKSKGKSGTAKRRRIKYFIIFSVLSLITVITIVIWKIQYDINAVYGPSQIKNEAKNDSATMNDLVGQWQRTDGIYVIEIRAVDDSGILDASYYNPRPINVSQSNAKDSGGMLEVFIELWDENYPGSTYNLVYDPIRNILYGTYYTPVAGQTFEVIFVRVE